MYYEINVSLMGKHFFATAPRSITSEKSLKEVFSIFQEKFPPEQGYKLSCYLCEETKTPLDTKNSFKEME